MFYTNHIWLYTPRIKFTKICDEQGQKMGILTKYMFLKKKKNGEVIMYNY